MTFPFQPLAPDASDNLRGAYLLTKQKIQRENEAHIMGAPRSAIDFAEEETERAVALLFQAYRDELPNREKRVSA